METSGFGLSGPRLQAANPTIAAATVASRLVILWFMHPLPRTDIFLFLPPRPESATPRRTPFGSEGPALEVRRDSFRGPQAPAPASTGLVRSGNFSCGLPPPQRPDRSLAHGSRAAPAAPLRLSPGRNQHRLPRHVGFRSSSRHPGTFAPANSPAP